MAIPMKCWHRDHKGEMWSLDLGDERAELRDAAGAMRGEFTRDEAGEQFLMPSFSESIKQFRLPVGGELWYFDVGKDDLKQIRAYIEHSVAAAGPDAVRAVRNAAIRDGVIGLVVLLVGVGITIGTHLKEADDPEGGTQSVVMYGAILVGLIMLGKGIYGLVRYNRLKTLAQTHGAAASHT